ncbi:MAG: hypothetical protein K8H90_08455 [Thermoanaerobaculia bacterium]|nr:hypothetical protein [Thermoanaerobaculia bacterium]
MSYLGTVAAILIWLFVTYRLDQKRAENLAVLREMHRQGRGPDIDAIINDPDVKIQKRAVQGLALIVVFVGMREWRAREERKNRAAQGK